VLKPMTAPLMSNNRALRNYPVDLRRRFAEIRRRSGINGALPRRRSPRDAARPSPIGFADCRTQSRPAALWSLHPRSRRAAYLWSGPLTFKTATFGLGVAADQLHPLRFGIVRAGYGDLVGIGDNVGFLCDM